jgi:zinc D-Ala-D-Ala carboxypeptidase
MIDLKKIHDELGIDSKTLAGYKPAPCAQPALAELEVVDIDFDGRPFILERSAAWAWRKMCEAARLEDVIIRPFSGFRSYIHQKKLIERQLENGRSLPEILTGTAIPGFSEHHTGKAVDVCTPEKFKLEEEFERTAAFSWLMENAGDFKFRLSYPRSNNLGIIYEPWHWYYYG